MPSGGDLTIETSNVTLHGSSHLSTLKPIPGGEYVVLTVQDSGVGMSSETQERIFEPFYTTKETGRGTGLGLSIVYGIVEQSNAYVTVQSEPGHGTRFCIYFPRVHAPHEDVRPRADLTATTRLDETVLLVEDEQGVRRYVSKVLGKAGMHVLEAGTGAEALAITRNLATPISLLIADMILPDMNGMDLAKSIAETRSHLPVLFMSGYTGDEIARRIATENVMFLEKPVAPAVLLAKVREALGKSS
jgi:two-component system, cell cycle sensor histidine kinase and response regulator CckA